MLIKLSSLSSSSSINIYILFVLKPIGHFKPHLVWMFIEWTLVLNKVYIFPTGNIQLKKEAQRGLLGCFLYINGYEYFIVYLILMRLLFPHTIVLGHIVFRLVRQSVRSMFDWLVGWLVGWFVRSFVRSASDCECYLWNNFYRVMGLYLHAISI